MEEILLLSAKVWLPKPTIDISQLADGTYTGEGQGLKGPITVEVTVAGGKITAVEVVSGSDTEEYFNQAKAEVPKRIVEEQNRCGCGQRCHDQQQRH